LLNGRLEQEGTHEELLARPGPYQRFVEISMRGRGGRGGGGPGRGGGRPPGAGGASPMMEPVADPNYRPNLVPPVDAPPSAPPPAPPASTGSARQPAPTGSNRQLAKGMARQTNDPNRDGDSQRAEQVNFMLPPRQ